MEYTFKVGDRVQLKSNVLSNGHCSTISPETTGTVVGRNWRPGRIRVRWDGCPTQISGAMYSTSDLKPVEAQP